MAKGKVPAFQFYPKDALADTAHLCPEAFAAYWRLVWYTMVGVAGCPQGRLPNDDEILSRLAGLSLERWEAVEVSVRGLFRVVSNGALLENRRVIRELKKQREFSRKMKQASRKGVEARTQKRQAKRRNPKVIDGVPLGDHRVNPDATSSSSSSKDQDLSVLPEIDQEPLEEPAREPESAAAARNGTHPDGVNVAYELVRYWIDHQPQRPPEAVIKKQHRKAKTLVARYELPDLRDAVRGIQIMFPHSEGEPWDLYDLERKFVKALKSARDGPRLSKRDRRIRDNLEAIDNANLGGET